MKIFAVKDRATDQFGTPMFMISSGQAIRSFSDEINRAEKENMLYMHPEDYDLWSFGEFDSNSGKFDLVGPEQIAIGKNVVIQKQ